MNNRIKHFLRENFGAGWEDMWKNPQDREYMIEVMYRNGIITINEIYFLGYQHGWQDRAEEYTEKVVE